jgi:hypothetical protein
MALTIEKLENGGIKVTKGSKSVTIEGPLSDATWDIKDAFDTAAKALEVGQNSSPLSARRTAQPPSSTEKSATSLRKPPNNLS